MSQSDSHRRRQQLLDRFLAGQIDQSVYERLLAEIEQLEGASPEGIGQRSLGRLPTVVGGRAELSPPQADRSGPLSPRHTPLSEGTQLGTFRIDQRLGRGGMGEVWKAYDSVGERSVVIKVLPSDLQADLEEMARVKQTFQRVHGLQHQHICPLYLLGQDPRVGYFLVMKYVEGITLSAYRRDYVAKHGTFPLEEVIRVLQPVASALDYAHRQRVVHRDIKPQNILVLADGSDVQVVDFGLAAEIKEFGFFPRRAHRCLRVCSLAIPAAGYGRRLFARCTAAAATLERSDWKVPAQLRGTH